ncbi:hypothetical protein [Leptospira santarosai]|uniref:hypothetical protein n=1 Tax=Leptospira santarosai TaxID=28183 RepID=UPI0024AEC9BE|nr:hypothetical protein [Leptospira santarosai]
MKTTDDTIKTILYDFARDLKNETASLNELISEYHTKISQAFREKDGQKKS